MNYKQIYDNLITKRKECQPLNSYTETHHIIPGCMGGSNEKENLVVLTAREHFIAHILLFKSCDDPRYKSKLAYAVFMMIVRNEKQRGRKFTSRQYEIARKIFTKYTSERMSGKNNPFYGKTFTKEAREKISMGRFKRMGSDNGMYGRGHSEDAKKAVSIANKGRLVGELNPSKREDVREKIRNTKTGSKNPNAKRWKVTTPKGEILYFHGGISHKIEKYGVTHSRASVANGWIIEKIEEFPENVIPE